MSKIDDKWQELKNSGRSLGDPLGPEQDAGFGGRFRRYTEGNIYWHPIMGDTGAHEVHGGILTKYLQFGGPGINPRTRKRDLDFPITDETRTADGLYPVSYFEWGAIYWVGGTGGVSIHNDIYPEWKGQGAELGPLGYPITDHIEIAGGD
jgi:uncharacterized protein with LGFP repeats